MAEAGSMAKGGMKPVGEHRVPRSVCDVSLNGFERTWQMLKERHDKQVHHLQEKLTANLKKLRSDGRHSRCLAKIKELTRQKKALNDTIHTLQRRLSSKSCDQCSINEIFQKTLQQEFYDIQQCNLKYLSKVTTERNQLREENKKLLENLKSKQQQLCPSLPGSARERSQGSPGHRPRKRLKNSDSQKKRSNREKASEPNPQVPTCHNQINLEFVSETSSVRTSSSFGVIVKEGRGNKRSLLNFTITPTLSSQMEYGLQGASLPLKDKRGPVKMRTFNMPKTSSKIDEADFSWSLSSIPVEETEPTKVAVGSSDENVSKVAVETADETMSDANSSWYSFSQTRERRGLHVFPLDYTSRCKRKSTDIACAKHGFLRKDTDQSLPKATLVKTTTTESTNEEHGTDTKSIGQATLKRKAKITHRRMGNTFRT